MIHDIEPRDYYTCDCDKYNPDFRCHPKEQVVSDQQPFDQSLYDAVMAELKANPIRAFDPVYTETYEHAAKVAARIAAERQAVAVSDEELDRIFWQEHLGNLQGMDGYNPSDQFRGVRAVRAAIGPTVPVIPEGWTVDQICFWDGQYECHLDYPGNEFGVMGYGPTWHDALTAAIQAAKEAEHE